MTIKRRIGISFATAILGIGLISGGTIAYFSDTKETHNRIEAGTLDLGIVTGEDEGVIFEFDNKQPGDTFDYAFNLTNEGSLMIGYVTLFSKHEVLDEDEQIIDNDFGSQIMIQKMMVDDDVIIHEKEELTLADLQDVELKLLEDFDVAEEAKIYVNFKFINDEDKDQNEYQGNIIKLNWTFEAMQTD